MVKTSKHLRKNTRPIRLMGFILGCACLLHIHQIYLESQQALEKTRQLKVPLFLSKKSKMKTNEKEDLSFYHRIRKKSTTTSCEEQKAVLFLKTHKTGSTTVTNIILRYALKNHLSVGLPMPRHWQLGGYPAFFDRKLVVPQLPKYDVLCHHLRYDQENLQAALSSNFFAITLFRDPADGFESGFAFFRDWPYTQWFDDITQPENLQVFLDDPHEYYNISTPWYFRAKNYMAFDLGFDSDRNDMQYSEMIVQEVSKHFDLVLITERMDESLVLLKDLLCIDSFEEIVYLRLKVRQDFARRNTTDKMRRQMREWNFLDTRLYEHFNKILDLKIRKYGQKKMKESLKKFQQLLEETNQRCILYYDQQKDKPWVSQIKLKDNADKLCETLSWGEVKFGDTIRHLQQSYVNTDLINQPSAEEMKMMFEKAQSSVIGIEAVKSSA